MTTVLETLKTYPNITALCAAAIIEAVPCRSWNMGYTWTIRMPVAQALAPKPHPTERHTTKRAAVLAGQTMLNLALSNTEISIPGYEVNTRKSIRLADFLAASSIDEAYERAMD